MHNTSESLWFDGPKRVAFKTRSVLPPQDKEVVIETLYSGISHGTEMLVYRGQVPQGLKLDLSIPTMEGSFSFPIKYGYSNVGRVVKTGKGVETLLVDDLVFVHAPHETIYVIPEDSAVKLDHGIAPELGIFIANLNTALNCILDSEFRFGENVIIFGQGVIGLLLTQLFKRAGASCIFTIDTIAKKRALSLQVGADISFDPEKDDIVSEIRRHTRGVGADLAVEVSGSPEALEMALKVVAFESTVIVASWYGNKRVPLTLGNEFHRGRIKIKSSQVSTMSASLIPRWNLERRMTLALMLLPTLTLRDFITHV
ncbi:MAG: zinc-binding alcohol dehydrogenase [Thermodesulfobacteriota bacterium]|nr:zinc-binding alcohol dehydrogenase [Thermodesulfobacteriota bacterium]